MGHENPLLTLSLNDLMLPPIYMEQVLLIKFLCETL